MAADRGLKTRGTLSTTVELELLSKVRELSEKTKVPISKLTDEAYEYLLKARATQK